MRQLVTCKICDRLLYEPYALSCGHTYCYICLTQWFTNNSRKKTCPDCRSVIVLQPTPSYIIKELVLIFVSRGRAFADKRQAIALVFGATAAVCAGVVKYVVHEPAASSESLLWGALILGGFGAAGRPVRGRVTLAAAAARLACPDCRSHRRGQGLGAVVGHPGHAARHLRRLGAGLGAGPQADGTVLRP